MQVPAGADRGPWPDPGDGRGALAIRKIEIGHIKSWEHASTVTVVFERPVYPAELKRRDFIVLDLSGANDGKSDVWLYFWGGDKQWYTHSYNPRTKSVGYGGFWIRRQSPRSFKIVLPYVDSYFDRDRGGYRFRLATVSRTGAGCASGCFDAVPNRSWLIHDWTRPWVERWRVPEFSMTPGEEPAVPVALRVTDSGFSGLAGWKVSKRVAGTDAWTQVLEGRSTLPQERLVPAQQGEKLQLRLEAGDGAGNEIKPRVRATVVPYDDANADAGATFLGLWEVQEREGAYLGDLHVSTSPLDSFRYTATARRYCVSYLVMEDGGHASFEVGNEQFGGLSMDHTYGGGAHGTECMEFDTEETRTVIVEVEEGVINIDGYWYE